MKMKRILVCGLLAVALNGCAPSRYVKTTDLELERGVTLDKALKYCQTVREKYRSAVRHTERWDQAAGAAVVVAGLGGLYEGVTGGSSRAITNYAVSGTLAYAGQQFFIRRPTRVEIYNAGIRQMNCVLGGVPSSAEPDWLSDPELAINGKAPESISRLHVHLMASIIDQQSVLQQNECGLSTTIAALEAKKSQLRDAGQAAAKVGNKVFSACDDVAIQVSDAINKDAPNTNDIRAFLSGLSLPSAVDTPVDPAPRNPDGIGPSSVDRCEMARRDSEALVKKIQLFLELSLMGMETLATQCVSEIVPQMLRIAGVSPYSVAKGENELKIKIIGGVEPLVIQQQVAKAGSPEVVLEEATRSIKVTATADTEAGAYGFSLVDANGSAAQFVIAVTDG